jgi:hypothetical protein
MELVAWTRGDDGIGSCMLYSGSKGMFHVPEMMGRRDGMIVTSWLQYMWTERKSKMAVQALLHICPTERREPEASLGNA